MSNKCKCPPAGAPDWMVTYGDMVTLLLCFFVLIVSFSEIKREDEFQAVVKEIQKAFGMKGGGGKLPTDDDPTLTLIERLEALQLKQQREPNRSNTIEVGMEGRETTVTTVRKGEMFIIGGPITFEPGSADLSNEGKAQIKKVVERFEIRGTNNIIELRGHTASNELYGVDSAFSDLSDLSHARAAAVCDYLVGTDIGLEARQIRLVSVSDYEPLVHRAYTDADRRPNRRVEMIVTEALVRDMIQPQTSSLN